MSLMILTLENQKILFPFKRQKNLGNIEKLPNAT